VLGRIGLAAPVLHRELDVVEPAGCSEAELLHAGEVREELERRARLAKRDPGVVIVALHLRRVDVVCVDPDVREDLGGPWIQPAWRSRFRPWRPAPGRAGPSPRACSGLGRSPTAPAGGPREAPSARG